MTPVRVGVVGAGHWGPNLIRTFSELPDAVVDTVVDRSQPTLDKLAFRFPQVRRFTRNLDELLNADLDAVVIATPPESHFEIARRCLAAGLDVMVEKPLTTRSTEAAELVRLADKGDRVLMVGHITEYNPTVRALAELIQSGELGDIHYIDGVRAGLGLFHPTLNVIWDLAPHEVSLFLFLLGGFPVEVRAFGMQCVGNSGADISYLTLKFDNGTFATTRLSWLDPLKSRRVNVVGSRKMAVYDDLATIERLRVFDVRVDHIEPIDTVGTPRFSYHRGDILSPHIEMVEPLLAECQHFLDSVMTRFRPQSDGASGLRVVRVIEAAQMSLAADGRPVQLTPVWSLSPGEAHGLAEYPSAR